jgi:hypothetical protein
MLLLPSQEANDIYSACLTAARAAVVDGAGIGGFGAGRQSTRDAVATIDDTVANCRDSGNSMVADFDWGEVVGSGMGILSEVVKYVYDDPWGDEEEVRPGVG